MKVVKSQDKTITMNELKGKFTNYIIAADLLDYTSITVYVLVFIEKKFKWIDLKTNEVFDENDTFDEVLDRMEIDRINVFEGHMEFADWLKSQEEEFYN